MSVSPGAWRNLQDQADEFRLWVVVATIVVALSVSFIADCVKRCWEQRRKPHA